MKGTIKIMKGKPEITDEEIRSHMNFERLLVQEKALANKSLYRNAGFLLTGIAVIAGLWFYSKDSNQHAVTSSSKKDRSETLNNAPEQKAKQESVVFDSAESKQTKKPETSTDRAPGSTAKQRNPVKNSVKEIPDSNPAQEIQTPPAVYTQAEPVDGYPALYEYFVRELAYPVQALKDSIQGVVTVAFTINAAGKPEKITIEQSIGSAFDKEAMRVISNMPLWKPAAYNGKPTSGRMSVPLTFQITKPKTP